MYLDSPGDILSAYPIKLNEEKCLYKKWDSKNKSLYYATIRLLSSIQVNRNICRGIVPRSVADMSKSTIFLTISIHATTNSSLISYSNTQTRSDCINVDKPMC